MAMSESTQSNNNVLNINIGILGHVDSGKTSLVKALSTSLSTAALDKNPQSQQRGITLDLGFSAFTLPISSFPKDIQNAVVKRGCDAIQFTLVDCPGHASLIRTIIGGAQIIDMMILVIDANKGIQTQTAECLVIGEITTDNLIVALNKVDSIPIDEREERIEKMKRRLRKVFSSTKFIDPPIVLTAAAIGGEKVASVGALNANSVQKLPNSGIDDLVQVIQSTVQIPNRNINSPFYFSIDHCFPIKGHGTVLTGTVLNGSIAVNGTVELPYLQIQRKVKSMQMFRKPVKFASQGDRVALCVTNLDPKLIERSIAVSPSSVPLLSTVICAVKKIRFFRFPCKSNYKYHVTIGHTTIIATVTFFGAKELADKFQKPTPSDVPVDDSQCVINEMLDNIEQNESDEVAMSNGMSASAPTMTAPATKDAQDEGRDAHSILSSFHANFPADLTCDYQNTDFEYQNDLQGSLSFKYNQEPIQFAVLQFQHPVFCPMDSLIIGSRLDNIAGDCSNDMNSNSKSSNSSNSSSIAAGNGVGSVSDMSSSGNHTCRLAFYGPILHSLPNDDDLHHLKIFHWKEKQCEVFRLTDVRNVVSEADSGVTHLCYEVIAWRLVSEGGDVQHFLGLKVETINNDIGVIASSYGSDGKIRIKFPFGAKVSVGEKLTLRFKRYIYDREKSMCQKGIDEPSNKYRIVNSFTSSAKTEANSTTTNKQKTNNSIKQSQIQSLGASSAPMTTPSMTSTTSTTESLLQSSNTVSKSTTANLAMTATNPSTTAMAPLTSTQLKANVMDNSTHNDSNNHVSTSAINNKIIVIGDVKVSTNNNSNSPSPQVVNSTGNNRTGVIESLKPSDDSDKEIIAIVNGAFRMEENIRDHINRPVCFQGIECGVLVGPFAKMGKCKVKLSTTVFTGKVGDVITLTLH